MKKLTSDPQQVPLFPATTINIGIHTDQQICQTGLDVLKQFGYDDGDNDKKNNDQDADYFDPDAQPFRLTRDKK